MLIEERTRRISMMHRHRLIVALYAIILAMLLCPIRPNHAYMTTEQLADAQRSMQFKKFYLYGEPHAIVKALRCVSQISMDPSLRYHSNVKSGFTLQAMEEFYPLKDGSKMAKFDNGLVGYPPQDMGPVYLLMQARRHPNRVTSIEDADFILMISFVNEYALVEMIREQFASGELKSQQFARELKECRAVQLSTDKYLTMYDQQVDDLDVLAHNYDIPFLWVCQSFRCGLLQTKYGKGNSFLSPYAYFAIHESNPRWLSHELTDELELSKRIAAIPYVGHSSFRSRKYRTTKALKKVKGTFFFAGDFRGTPVREAFAKISHLPYVHIKLVEAEDKDGQNVTEEKPNDVYDGLDPYVINVTTNEFCFVPRGDTPSSRRLFDAVLAGCIPVVISNKVDLPFAHAIPWSKIIIRVEESAWVKSPSSVVREVRNIATEDRTSMRHYMSLYWREIDYGSRGNVFSNMLISFNEAYNRTQAYLADVRQSFIANGGHASGDKNARQSRRSRGDTGVSDSSSSSSAPSVVDSQWQQQREEIQALGSAVPEYDSYSSSDSDWVKSVVPNQDYWPSDDAAEKQAAKLRVRWNQRLYWKHWAKAFPEAAKEEMDKIREERQAAKLEAAQHP